MSDNREEIRATFVRESLRDIAEDMGRDDATWCIMHDHPPIAPAFTGEDAEELLRRWHQGCSFVMERSAKKAAT